MTKKNGSTFMNCTKSIVKAFYTFSLLACILLITQCQRSSKSGQTNEGLDKATTFAYYPSLRNLEIRIGELGPEIMTGPQKVQAILRLQGKNKTVARQKFSVSEKGGNYSMKLPALKDGTYELTVSLNGGGSEVKKIFKHKNYPWLGNDLGKKDMIYPPFEPIKVNDNMAQVVLRDYQMNGFGLWNSVKSEGKEILAAPITLSVQTANGEEIWKFSGGEWTTKLPHLAVYEVVAKAPSVAVRTKSSLEYDGCMKVEMDLLPGDQAQTINQLWLDIPLNDKEVSLFHPVAFDKMRENYAGAIPRGGKIRWDKGPHWIPSQWIVEQPGSDDGVIWTCHDPRPGEKGKISPVDFIPYIWLGGATRGIAFFGENDKGYSLDPDGTVQTIERKGETLHLRIYLVNKPTVIKTTRHIVFGLQASPTRPMPENWRNTTNVPPHGGPVVCWGGYHCSDKYPDGHNFKIIDAIQEGRKTGNVDMAIFQKFDKERAEPDKRMWEDGNEPWLGNCMNYFINVARGASRRPTAIQLAYFEEHASDITNEEWEIYQDEWRSNWPWTKGRTEITPPVTKPRNNFGFGHQNYPDSYLDFCLYYANEWMKRGVGLYFDNTMPYAQSNPLTSDAFVDENGKTHPACSIWEQRTYYKRIWTLMNKLSTEGGSPYPLAYVQHTTNTMLLPFNTWNTATLDIEWTWTNEKPAEGQRRGDPNPFPPALLLTQTSGRQTGSLPHALHNVRGGDRRWWDKADAVHHLPEWGIRMVHEIIRTPHPSFNTPEVKKLENAVRDFGYGKDNCEVINYWSDNSPINVDNPNVKWLAVSRKSDNSLLIVLQSWNRTNTPVNISFDDKKLGYSPKATAFDVGKGASMPATGSSVKCTLQGPFGTKVVIIGAQK